MKVSRELPRWVLSLYKSKQTQIMTTVKLIFVIKEDDFNFKSLKVKNVPKK